MMALVTGGASCGKSAFSERLATALGGRLVYLAAMRPHGKEARRRIERHRAQRAGKGFTTVECHGGLDGVLRDVPLDKTTVLLECLGNVLANALFAGGAAAADPEGVRERVAAAVGELARRSAHLIVVTDEVGCDGAGYPDATRCYQRLLGGLSCEIAAMSALVVECVCGVPVPVKASAAAAADPRMSCLLRGEVAA